jgi:hypothetical protein
MMEFDHHDDIQLIKSFVAKTCERTLACNSLKLRFGHKKTYIWIDPPWTLCKGDSVITSSDDCPEDTDAFKIWSESLKPLNKTVFAAFEHTTEGDLRLIFDHDFNLRIPFTSNTADDEDFYAHWYASAGEVLTQEAQEGQV